MHTHILTHFFLDEEIYPQKPLLLQLLLMAVLMEDIHIYPTSATMSRATIPGAWAKGPLSPVSEIQINGDGMESRNYLTSTGKAESRQKGGGIASLATVQLTSQSKLLSGSGTLGCPKCCFQELNMHWLNSSIIHPTNVYQGPMC